MVTVGIDLAAQDRDTAVCHVEWRRNRAAIVGMASNTSDSELLELIPRANKVGIDTPLGWPDTFVEAVTWHKAGSGWPNAERLQLCFRATDLYVQRETGSWPLSVSADKIAIPAMRGARLMSKLNAPVDRTGQAAVVEVYPAAALRRWGFNPRGYKGDRGRELRDRLIRAFEEKTTGWIMIEPRWRSECERSDNAFDSLIGALVARASALGLCDAIPTESLGAASREGWIALPASDSLDRLLA